jgi:hypothetical protein
MPTRPARRVSVRPLVVTASAVAGLGLAAGGGTISGAAAGAASGPHWSIVARSNSALGAIVAPAGASAWVFGSKSASPASPSRPAGVHWNGHRWSPVSFPASVKSGIGCAAVSSPGNVWAFAGAAVYGNGTKYAGALRLAGGKWVVKKSFVPGALVSGCSVLSPTSAWVYGLTHVAPGVGTWRLTSRTWHRATTGTFSLIAASEVSAGDMWATAADSTGNDDVVAHWNGATWSNDSSFAAALPAQSSTLMWNVSAINAVGAGNVWVSGSILRLDSHGNWIPSPYVLHLSSGSWHKVGRANPGYYLPDAVSDGHGGWWSPGNGLAFGIGNASATPYLLHQTGGRWHRVTVATAPKGTTMAIMDVAHVPGSNAMLAVAALYNGKPGLYSVVLAYGQLPK